MLIKKTFHFYAAHRNQHLKDKCRSLHGHRYGVSVFFEAKRDNDNVSTPFSAFMEAALYLKVKWDHALIIDKNDPLYKFIDDFNISQHEDKNEIPMKTVLLDRPSSVENICFQIFHDLITLGYSVSIVEIQETDTSTICYSYDDYDSDLLNFMPDTPKTIEHECSFKTDPSCVKCSICGKTRYEYRIQERTTNRNQSQT